MFHHSEVNSYLQLVCPMEPRVINKVMRNAMKKKHLVAGDDFSLNITLLPAWKQESQQPSLSAPCVDVTVAHLGFERIGLTILIRELNSPNKLVRLQAIHTLLDQVQIPTSIFFVIKRNVVYRLIDMMVDNDPIVREKVAIILTRLGTHHQGREQIISRPIVFEHLIGMFMQDRKEVRYASSLFLKTMTRYRCCCAVILQNDRIVECLLKMIKHDYMEIVLYHLNSLKNLSEWDPVRSLKANAFQVMKQLLIYHHYRVVQAAMDCMTQLCKHSVGKQLADKYDMNDDLIRFLLSPDMEVVISTLGLLQYTTTTERSLWRMKQFKYTIVKRLVALALAQSLPILQARAIQVLINLCECSDIRIELKVHWENVIIKNLKIRTHESWLGTHQFTSYGLAIGYNYETMCMEDVNAIKEDYGDTVTPDDVHSYLSRMTARKKKLIAAMNQRKDKY